MGSDRITGKEITPLEYAAADELARGNTNVSTSMRGDINKARASQALFEGEVFARKYGLRPTMSEEQFRLLEKQVATNPGTQAETQAQAVRISTGKETLPPPIQQVNPVGIYDSREPVFAPKAEPEFPSVLSRFAVTPNNQPVKPIETPVNLNPAKPVVDEIAADDARRTVFNPNNTEVRSKEEAAQEAAYIINHFGKDAVIKGHDGKFKIREDLRTSFSNQPFVTQIENYEYSEPGLSQFAIEDIAADDARRTVRQDKQALLNQINIRENETESDTARQEYEAFTASGGYQTKEEKQKDATLNALLRAVTARPTTAPATPLTEPTGASLTGAVGTSDSSVPQVAGPSRPEGAAPAVTIDDEGTIFVQSSDSWLPDIIEYWADAPLQSNIDTAKPEDLQTPFEAIIEEGPTGQHYYNPDVKPYGLQHVDLNGDFAQAVRALPLVNILSQGNLPDTVRGNLYIPMITDQWGKIGIDVNAIKRRMIENKFEAKRKGAISDGLNPSYDELKSMMDESYNETEEIIQGIIGDNPNAVWVNINPKETIDFYENMGPLLGPIAAMLEPTTIGSFRTDYGQEQIGQTVEDLNEYTAWGMSKASIGTLIGSWLLDPKIIEAGFGSRDHIEKILTGYDLGQDIDKFASGGEYATTGLLSEKILPEPVYNTLTYAGNALGVGAWFALTVRDMDFATLGTSGAGLAVRGVRSVPAIERGLTTLDNTLRISTTGKANQLIDKLTAIAERFGAYDSNGKFVPNTLTDAGQIGTALAEIKALDASTGHMADSLLGFETGHSTSVSGHIASEIVKDIPKHEQAIVDLTEKVANLATESAASIPEQQKALDELVATFEQLSTKQAGLDEAGNAIWETHGSYIEPFLDIVTKGKDASESTYASALLVELLGKFKSAKDTLLAIPKYAEIATKDVSKLAALNRLYLDLRGLATVKADAQAAEKALNFNDDQIRVATKILEKMGPNASGVKAREMLDQFDKVVTQRNIQKVAALETKKKLAAIDAMLKTLGFSDEEAKAVKAGSNRLSRLHLDITDARRIVDATYGVVRSPKNTFKTVWAVSEEITRLKNEITPAMAKASKELSAIKAKLDDAAEKLATLTEKAASGDISNPSVHTLNKAIKLSEHVEALEELKRTPEKFYRALQQTIQALENVKSAVNTDSKALALRADWKNPDLLHGMNKLFTKSFGDVVRRQLYNFAKIFDVTKLRLGILNPLIIKASHKLKSLSSRLNDELIMLNRYGGNTLEYLTTTKAIEFGPKGRTALNTNRATSLGEGGIHFLAGLIRQAKEGERTPFIEEFIEAISRSQLPSGERVAHATTTIRNQISEYIIKLSEQLTEKKIDSAQALEALATEVNRITQSILKRTDPRKAFTDSIIYNAVALAGLTGDEIDKLSRELYFNIDGTPKFTEEQFKAVIDFTRGAYGKLDEVENPGRIVYDILATVGIGPLSTITKGTIYSQSATESLRALTEMTAVPIVNGKAYLPYHVMADFESASRTLIKSIAVIEPGATKAPWDRINDLARLWRTNVITGMWPIPKATHWFKTYFGDIGQAFVTEGFATSSRIAFSELPSVIPYGSVLNKYLARGEGVLPSMMASTLNVHTTKVFMSTNDIVPGTKFTYAQLNKMLAEHGIFDTMTHETIMEVGRLAGLRGEKGGLQQFLKNRQDSVVESITYLQQRTRVAMAADLIVNRGLSVEQAAKRTLDALYDWKAPVTEWEAHWLSNLVTFYRYFRLSTIQAFKIMAQPLTAAHTMATGDNALKNFLQVRKDTEQFRRLRALAQFDTHMPLLGLPDREQTLNEEEELRTLASMMRPSMSSNGYLGGTTMSTEMRRRLRESEGTEATHWANLAPPNAVMDSMQFILHTGKLLTIMGASPPGTKPSSFAWEQGVNAWADRLMPMYADVIKDYMDTEFKKNENGVRVKNTDRRVFEGLYNANKNPNWDRIIPDEIFQFKEDNFGKSELYVNPLAVSVWKMLPVFSAIPSYTNPWITNPKTETAPALAWWARNMVGFQSIPYNPQRQLSFDVNRRREALRKLGDTSVNELENAEHE